MNMNKESAKFSVAVGIVFSLGLSVMLYRSLANDFEHEKNSISQSDSEVVEEMVEEAVGDINSNVEVVELVEEVNEDEESVSVEREEDSSSSQSIDEKLDEGVNKEEVKAVINVDTSLPKLVGIDARKKTSSDEEIPYIPGFVMENGVYTCELNNGYNSVIKIKKVKEDGVSKIIVRVGAEVMEDEQLKSIIRIILDYYKGCKWEFVYNGDSSCFEIKL